MRSRFRFWLKKRGGRRTGSPRTALTAEALYYGVFIAVGAVALWLHSVNVLAPAWRLSRETSDYQVAECRILDKRVVEQPGLAGAEFVPYCRVRLLSEDAPQPPTWAPAGEPRTSSRLAHQVLEHCEVGQTHDCWRHPTDPTRVTLVHGGKWWPWLVTLIPLSLIALGVIGIVRAFLQAGVSAERRRTLAMSARTWDTLFAPLPMQSAEALPDMTPVTDSPGVRLKHRLPSLGDAGWRIATLATISIAWNLLIAFFVIGIVVDIWAGRPQWALAIAIAPLALAGVYMTIEMFRHAREASGVGSTSVEVDEHPLYPGRAYDAIVLQSGHFKLRALSVWLTCEEIATYCEGTDTRTSSIEVFREVIVRQQRCEVEPGKPFEQELEFRIPSQAMHSFQSAHNEVRWALEVRVTPQRWPAFTRRFLVCVFPPVGDAAPWSGRAMTGAT